MWRMAWSNGSSYAGDLVDSVFHGHGTLIGANSDTYCGEWKCGKRHGVGDFTANHCALDLPSGGLALSSSYSGEWDNDNKHGQGCIKFFAFANGWKGGKAERIFEGQFNRGFPTTGSLHTKQEFFEQVQFDRHTPTVGFPVWYWSGDACSEARGTSLVDVHRGGEEFETVKAQFSNSVSMSDMIIKSIQRVQNHEMRLIYELQRRALEKKVTGPPRSMRWNPHTMERWAFHAPGRGRDDEDAPGAATPCESIVEEGFQTLLAGSENGKKYGAGIYLAKCAAMSHQFAQRAAHKAEYRVFVVRIVTGMYTVGQYGMNQPPIDTAGAKGEHFHSLVDNLQNPSIFVINDNTRAYPAYLVTYESSLSSSGRQRNPLLGVPAGACHSSTKASHHSRGRTMETGPMLRQPWLAASGNSHGSGSFHNVPAAGQSIHTANLGIPMPPSAAAAAAAGQPHRDKRKREYGVGDGGGDVGRSGHAIAAAALNPSATLPPRSQPPHHPCVDDNDRLADNLAIMHAREASEERRQTEKDARLLLNTPPF